MKKISVESISKGVFKLDKKNRNENTELAGRTYQPSDYKKNDTLSSGLATTHEQVNDAYMEGEIGSVIEKVKGKDISLTEE